MRRERGSTLKPRKTTLPVMFATNTRPRRRRRALRRVATLVARGTPADELFAAVPGEVGQLLQADQTSMSRYESDGMVTVVAGWSRTGDAAPPVGARLRLGGKNLTTIVSQTRRPAEGRLWGVMIGGSSEHPLPWTPRRVSPRSRTL